MIFKIATLYLLWRAGCPTTILIILAAMCILRAFFTVMDKKAAKINSRLVLFSIIQDYKEFDKEMDNLLDMLNKKSLFSYVYVAKLQTLIGKEKLLELNNNYNGSSDQSE